MAANDIGDLKQSVDRLASDMRDWPGSRTETTTYEDFE